MPAAASRCRTSRAMATAPGVVAVDAERVGRATQGEFHRAVGNLLQVFQQVARLAARNQRAVAAVAAVHEGLTEHRQPGACGQLEHGGSGQAEDGKLRIESAQRPPPRPRPGCGRGLSGCTGRRGLDVGHWVSPPGGQSGRSAASWDATSAIRSAGATSMDRRPNPARSGGNMRTHRHPVLGSAAAAGQHGFVIAGVVAAGYVGAGDQRKHRSVVAHRPGRRPIRRGRCSGRCPAGHSPSWSADSVRALWPLRLTTGNFSIILAVNRPGSGRERAQPVPVFDQVLHQ